MNFEAKCFNRNILHKVYKVYFLEKIIESMNEPMKFQREFLALVFKNCDDLEDLKKFKLVSKDWYRAVDNLFQHHLTQKFQTHFDGRNEPYFAYFSQFGQNLNNYCDFAFSSFKISHTYFDRLGWLQTMVLENIQNLHLENNLLNWTELLEIFLKFPNLIKFRYSETFSDPKWIEKSLSRFQDKFSKGWFKADLNDVEIRQLVKDHLGDRRLGFLRHLKSIEIHIICPKMCNLLAIIISCASKCQPENISVKLNLYGLYLISKKNPTRISDDDLKMNFLAHFSRYSEFMKKVEIEVDQGDLPILDNFNFAPQRELPYVLRSRVCNSVMRIFENSPDQILRYRGIEEIKIKLPNFNIPYNDSPIPAGLVTFLRNQIDLKKFEISQLGEIHNMDNYNNLSNDEFETMRGNTSVQHYLRNLTLGNGNGKSICQIGYQIIFDGFSPILQFQQNLTKLSILLVYKTNWHFDNPNIPVFPQCKELDIKTCPFSTPYGEEKEWRDFRVRAIQEKFPNLEKLSLISISASKLKSLLFVEYNSIKPKVSNEDLQFIIRNFANLKSLHLENCLFIDNRGVTGLTPLALERLEERLEWPQNVYIDLPILPGERDGLPISHMKNLENLVLKNEANLHFAFRRTWLMNDVSNVGAYYGFDNMPKLKNLEIISDSDSKITPAGFEILKDKIGSKKLTIIST